MADRLYDTVSSVYADQIGHHPLISFHLVTFSPLISLQSFFFFLLSLPRTFRFRVLSNRITRFRICELYKMTWYSDLCAIYVIGYNEKICEFAFINMTKHRPAKVNILTLLEVQSGATLIIELH